MKLSDFDKNNKNPFMEQAITKVQSSVVKKYKNNSGTSDKAIIRAVNADGELVGHTTFVRQIEVDEDKFTKFYLSNFANFFDLSKGTIRVLGYILTCLIPNKDAFFFDMKECLEYTMYKSKVPVYKALGELCANNIIARTENDSKFFINPMVLFNGNRITFAKTYVAKENDKLD